MLAAARCCGAACRSRAFPEEVGQQRVHELSRLCGHRDVEMNGVSPTCQIEVQEGAADALLGYQLLKLGGNTEFIAQAQGWTLSLMTE